jgi:hypothetical protein
VVCRRSCCVSFLSNTANVGGFGAGLAKGVDQLVSVILTAKHCPKTALAYAVLICVTFPTKTDRAPVVRLLRNAGARTQANVRDFDCRRSAA